MKINVASIIRDHWATLYDAKSNKLSLLDIIIFYGVPIVALVCAYISCFRVQAEAYSVSITFFGIFLALLLNIQVAIFGIFQRRWEIPGDERLADEQANQLADRQTLLGELNTNISYLTVVSCIALVAFLIFFISKMTSGLGPAFALALYTHFILTFLMIVKRAHALFQKEYSGKLG